MQSDPRDEPWAAEDSPEDTHTDAHPEDGVPSRVGPTPAGPLPTPVQGEPKEEAASPPDLAVDPPASPPRMPDAGQVLPPSVPPPAPPQMPAPGVKPTWASQSSTLPASAGASEADGPSRSGYVEPEHPTLSPLAPVIASPVEGDWLSTVCPYLQSEDGSHIPSQADPGHRCAAQHPPGSPPLAFQERFCLTERHPRCEMFKYAQEVGPAGSAPAAGASGTTSGSRRAAVSLVIGSSGGDAQRRPALLVAAGIAGVIVIVLIVLLMGSCSGGSGGPEPSDDASIAPQTSGEATRAPATAMPATAVPESSAAPEATGGPPDGATQPPQVELLIRYQVQEGEALLRIAETFGVTRRSILMANEGMADSSPYVAAGDIIIVPVSSELTIEEVESIPGYQGLAP